VKIKRSSRDKVKKKEEARIRFMIKKLVRIRYK